MAMFRKIEFLPDKFEQRVKPFSALVSDVKLETTDNGTTYIVIEFGEEEAPLKINLGFPDKWVETNGGQVPKPGSTIYKFLKSLSYIGIDPLINDDLTEIKFEPSIIGKECSFDVVSKTFDSQTDVDEKGEPKKITFYTWTLTKVVDPLLKSQAKPTAVQKPATETPVKSAELKPEVKPETSETCGSVDMETVKRNWVEIINNVPEDKFVFSALIKAKGQFMSGKQFSELEKAQYNNITNVKKIINELVEEGYIHTAGPDYTKDKDAIFLALA